MIQFEPLLRRLNESAVDYIIIGGVAASAHGVARATFDLDIVYSREPGNLGRLVSALSSISPYLRGAPPGLPFRLDVETIRKDLNFTLTTDLGPIALLGEVAGGGGYEQLLPHTIELVLWQLPCRILGLDKLIEVKRAAGRAKDFEAVAELEALRDEIERGD